MKKKKIKKLAKIMMMMMIMKFQNDFLKLISPVRFRFEKKKKKGETKQNKTNKKTDTQVSENKTAKLQQRRSRGK